MKAIELVKYGNAADAFEIREMEIPEIGDNQVLIKVSTFGLNFADVMARRGLYKAAPPAPCVLGYEVAGHIEKPGSAVKDYKPGERVVAFTRFGGYAEYALADVRALARIPDHISNGEAAALTTQYCTAYHAAYDAANIRKGETILVHAAAGGVGIAVIQLARERGCIVAGTVGSQEKVDFIKGLGVDYAINYRTHDFVEEIRRQVPGGVVDVVLDPIGGSTFKKGRSLLNVGGRIVGYGASDQLNRKGGWLSKVRLLLGFGYMNPVSVLIQSQGVLGVNMLKIADHKPEVLQRVMNKVMDLARKGSLKPYIGKEYRAGEIAEAHAFLESRNSIGKIVLHW